MLLLSPLYYGMITDDQGDFYRTYGIIAILSYFNLFAGFQEQRLRNEGIRGIYRYTRWLVNFLFLAGLFYAYSLSYMVWLPVLGLGVGYYIWLSFRRDLFWLYLVEMEQRHLLRFYRFAGLFMDVPHLPVQVKEETANPY